MKFSKIKYILFVAVLLVTLTGAMASAENYDKPVFDNSSVLVITKPRAENISLQSVNEEFSDAARSVFDELGITETSTLMNLSAGVDGVSLFSQIGSGREIVKLTLPEAGEDKVNEAVELLNSSGAVEYAQPNYYIYLDSYPNDKYYNSSYSYRYHLEMIGAQKVWNMNIDCSAVNVAIIDSGVFIEHEDIADNVWTNPLEIPGDGLDNDGNGYIDDIHGWDFTTATSANKDPATITDPYDSSSSVIQGHGTHVSGIVSGVTNNGKGIASLSRNAKIVAVRTFDDSKSCTSDILIAGLNYIKQCNEHGNKIPIANCSLGGTTFGSTRVNIAVKEAFASSTETLFTCAAGNNSSSNDSILTRVYPASYGYDNIISIASSSSDDTLSSFSNYGSLVDIAAPGENILSTRNTRMSTSSYGGMSGTSQAAPLVASAAAVIKAKYPSLTPKQIKQAIINGADTVSTLSYTDANSVKHTINGNRRLNVYEALKWAGSPYRITWKDDTGTVVDTTYVEYKNMPWHDGIIKESSEEYKYTFKGWTPSFSMVDDDAEYTAVFEAERISYLITWKDYDGSVIDSSYVGVGETPSHQIPERESDAGYSYTFTGWTPLVQSANSNAEYTAVYVTTENDATKTYIDVCDKFEDKLLMQKTITTDGDALLTVIPKDGAKDIPDNITAYLVRRELDGTPLSIRKINFVGNSAVISKADGENYSLFIWTDDYEPLTYPIIDMTDFWNNPSQ